MDELIPVAFLLITRWFLIVSPDSGEAMRKQRGPKEEKSGNSGEKMRFVTGLIRPRHRFGITPSHFQKKGIFGY